jgi:hypothetical protein
LVAGFIQDYCFTSWLLLGKQPHQKTALQEQGLTTELLALLLVFASIRGRSSDYIAFDWLLGYLQGCWIQANNNTKEPHHRNRV